MAASPSPIDTASIERAINRLHASLPAGSRVVVGLSGGVDSAVAAALLLDAGYRVEALFMKNWDDDDGTEYCTAAEDLLSAEGVAAQLGIDLHTASFSREYWDNVFEAFLHDYRRGFTPNPDVLCNREIKFKQFTAYSATLGADAIATGHYVRRVDGASGAELHRAQDTNKDQTYFLLGIHKHELERALFPLGELTKPQVRAIARDRGLHNHERKDSTGICFIGERRFRDFLNRYLPAQPGSIVDTAGKQRGEHMGVAYYTLGQREGLGIGGQPDRPPTPWYVVGKDVVENRLVVSQDERDLDSDYLIASAPNWLIDTPTMPITVNASVRYRQAAQACRVTVRADGLLRVRFASPQRAVTPGQFVCFYHDGRCLGGATIEGSGTHAL